MSVIFICGFVIKIVPSITTFAIMDKLGLKSRETFRKNYMNPAIEMGAVRMTLPDKPNSKNQRYVKV